MFLEILVSNIDPAMTIPDELLPPKKYPTDEVKFALRRLYQVKNATALVKSKKVMNVMIKLESIS